MGPSDSHSEESAAPDSAVDPTAVSALTLSPEVLVTATVLGPSNIDSENPSAPEVVSPNSPDAASTTGNPGIYSLAPAATALYSNGIAVPILDSPPKPHVFSFEGSRYTADSASKLVIGGQTLQLGVPATTVNDRPPDMTAVAAPVLTFGGSSYTANLAGGIVVAGQTLAPGSAIILFSTQISLLAGGSKAVVGASTQLLVPAGITSAPVIIIGGSTYTAYTSSNFVIEGETLISVDGATYTANASSDFVIAGQTLTPGGVITVSGTPVSYAAAGTHVVVGTSTEAVGLGGLIMSGFRTGAQGTSAVAFTGDVPDRHTGKRLIALPLLASLMLLIALY